VNPTHRTQTRRQFLRNSSAIALGAIALPSAASDSPTTTTDKEGKAIEPGLQLYTVRAPLEQDYPGTLDQVAAIGYRKVQVTARFGHSAADVRGWLDGSGLVCPSVHLDVRQPVEAEIEAAQGLGAESVFLSAPMQLFKLDGDKVIGIRTDVGLDTWREIAEEQNERGAKFRDAGLTYGYHNHHFEFIPVDGVLPYDILLERTDPELVALEADVGWMQVAGVDVLDYFDRFPGRFPVCHVKDVLADGSFVDPGEGTVDFQRIFDASEQAGLRHYFVEHDSATDPMATARAGYAYLSTLRAR
jgi:sugar phosphate isomerase/epimerase